MSLLLAFALLLGGSGPSLPAAQDGSLSGLVREACVETGLRREAFESLAHSKRWASSRTMQVNGEAAEWTLAFRSDRALIFMSSAIGEGDANPTLAASCTVSMARPNRDWRADVEALAAELELELEPDPGIPGAEMRTWAKPMGPRLTSAYQPANRTASVTFSRPIVVSNH